MSNASGASLKVSNLGAAIMELCLPDRFGALQDVVLGYDSAYDYFHNPDYFGVVVGRVANRIGAGRFSLANSEYQLAQNEGRNHLHGGYAGFHQQLWTLEYCGAGAKGENIRLGYLSRDGEEHYPGNLQVEVTYCLTDANQLLIDYSARTDRTTLVNLTQHSYFNLAGHNSGAVVDHRIRVNASHYTPVTNEMLPTGAISSVAGTPLDLRQFRRVGDLLEQSHPSVRNAGALDHNFVLKRRFDNDLQLAAEVFEPLTGRRMRVLTDQPGLQLYSGRRIAAGASGKQGATYGPCQGLCLETQHFPDAPNQKSFPAITLQPGQTFKSRTVYQFDL